MQPLGNVLQNSCSTLLLKKQLNHTYEKLHRGIFYNKSRTTVLCLDSEFSKGPEVLVVPRVLGVHGILRYWGFRGPGGPKRPGGPKGSRGPGGSRGPVGPEGPTFLPYLQKCDFNKVANFVNLLKLHFGMGVLL